MVEHLERGDFLQRMGNESSRRKEDKSGVSESECTFTPRINKNAANLRRRSVKVALDICYASLASEIYACCCSLPYV